MTMMNNALKPLTEMPPAVTWLSDMDGVLVKENRTLPGANEFLDALRHTNAPFLVLTNNSIFTNRGLSARLANSGLDVPEESIWTFVNATATSLVQQSPKPTVYVTGEAGLTTTLHGTGYAMTEQDSEYIVLGEARTYDFNSLTRAVQLAGDGTRFTATNPDVTGPSNGGVSPVIGSIVVTITAAIGKRPYFVDKPNPVMIRAGLNKVSAHSEHTAVVGDRMDTDVQTGVEVSLRTHLASSGSMSREQIKDYPYRPSGVHEEIGELVELVKAHIG